VRTTMNPRRPEVLAAHCLWVCVGVLVGMAGQVQAVTYVVDNAAPGAADTNPGTEAVPWSIRMCITWIRVTRLPRMNRGGDIRPCRWRA
jgi:hypothetical protein